MTQKTAFGDGEKPGWFRERTFGIGYGPSSWQGWLTTAVYLVFVVGTGMAAQHFIPLYRLGYEGTIAAVALFVVYTAIFLRILYTHRETA